LPIDIVLSQGMDIMLRQGAVGDEIVSSPWRICDNSRNLSKTVFSDLHISLTRMTLHSTQMKGQGGKNQAKDKHFEFRCRVLSLAAISNTKEIEKQEEIPA
jgi:hypothetical protein